MSKTIDDLRMVIDALENFGRGESDGQPLTALVAALGEAVKDTQAMQHAILRMHACKGRYHMQQATCDLYDLMDLPNVRPTK